VALRLPETTQLFGAALAGDDPVVRTQALAPLKRQEQSFSLRRFSHGLVVSGQEIHLAGDNEIGRGKNTPAAVTGHA